MRDYGIKIVHGRRLAWFKEGTSPDHWHKRFSESIAQSHQQMDNSVPKLVEILASVLPRKGKILEAGCGTGWIVAALLQQGLDIEGVDYSEQLIAEVQNYKPNLPVKVGDVSNLEVPDNYYSGYISLGVIEHRYDGPEPFLKEAYRVLKPGGVMCISVPYFNLVRRAKAFFGSYRQNHGDLEFYQYGYSKGEFKSLLATNGFVVERTICYGAVRNFQEEFSSLHLFLNKQRLLWRLPKILNKLDNTDIAHMVMAVARKL